MMSTQAQTGMTTSFLLVRLPVQVPAKRQV
jgi:hypothetical protein